MSERLSVTSFETHRLSSGLSLHILPSEKFKRVTVGLFFPTLLEEKTTETALLAQVLLRGSQKFPSYEALQRELERCYGASLSSGVLKLGSLQVLYVQLSFPNERYLPTKPRLAPELVQVLSDVVERPYTPQGAFPEEVIGAEKQQLAHQIQSLINDKSTYAYYRFLEHMCPHEPFRLYPYGSLEELETITPKSLCEYHTQLLETVAPLAFVVGDVEPKVWIELWEETFSLSPHSHKPLLYPSPSIEAASGDLALTEEAMADLSQCHLYVGFRTPIHVYEGDIYAMVAANALYGVFPHSKLFWHLREEKGLAYSTYSHYVRPQGLIYAYAGLSRESVPEAIQIVQDQWQALQNGEISDFELESTINGLVFSTESVADSPGQWIQFALRRVLAGQEADLARVLEEIRAVTKERIQRAAQTVSPCMAYLLSPEGQGE